jgi:hypothetical protein
MAHAVRGCEFAVTMLADDRAVQDAIFGADGMLQALPLGAVHMSTSTISVEMSKRLATTHTAAGQGYIATPLLGRLSSSLSLPAVWSVTLFHTAGDILTIFAILAFGFREPTPQPQVRRA